MIKIELRKQTEKMKTKSLPSPMPKNIVSEFLFETGILSISKTNLPIRELQTKSPMIVDYQKLTQPELVKPLAKQIAAKILENNSDVMIIAGSTSPLLAFCVASELQLPFLWVLSQNMPDIFGQKIIFVADVIITGRNTTNAINSILNNGGICENAYSVFDYNFNLSTKGLRNVNIFSLLEIEDIENLKPISKWRKKSRYLFGKENRKETFFPAITD